MQLSQEAQMMRPVIVGHFNHSHCCGRNIPVEVIWPVEIGADYFLPTPPRCSVTLMDLWQTSEPTREMRDIP